MSIPTFLTYNGDASSATNPARPSVGDLGGAAFVDDSSYVPDPNTQLTASAENQNEMAVAALAQVTPVALFYVKMISGVPSIYGMRAASTILSTSDITVNDLGTGFTELTCPATKLIQPFFAMVTVQSTGAFQATAYVNSAANGIRIETRDSSGALTDVNFAVSWF